TALGLSLRSYLEHLKLQMLPRLSIVLTFVVIIIAVISLFSHKLRIERALSVSLFPMVILSMTIERLPNTWAVRAGRASFKVALGTLIAASLSHLLMTIPELTYFVVTFPGVLLVLVGFMLAMGRYRGYPLTERMRFKALTKRGWGQPHAFLENLEGHERSRRDAHQPSQRRLCAQVQQAAPVSGGR